MKLAGFQGTTLIDYPGRVAATLFSIGCNFSSSPAASRRFRKIWRSSQSGSRSWAFS